MLYLYLFSDMLRPNLAAVVDKQYTSKMHVFLVLQEKEIRRFAGTVPNATTTGDIESMVMYGGQGVGLIKEILPAGQVVKRIIQGAQNLINQQFLDHKSQD